MARACPGPTLYRRAISLAPPHSSHFLGPSSINLIDPYWQAKAAAAAAAGMLQIIIPLEAQWRKKFRFVRQMGAKYTRRYLFATAGGGRVLWKVSALDTARSFATQPRMKCRRCRISRQNAAVIEG
jgi:hypothetical protein